MALRRVDAVKAVGEPRRIGVQIFKNAVGVGQGRTQVVPTRKIGGGLEVVALTGHAEKLNLHRAVAVSLDRGRVGVFDGGDVAAAGGVLGIAGDVDAAVRGDGDGGGAVVAIGRAVVADDPLLVAVGI